MSAFPRAHLTSSPSRYWKRSHRSKRNSEIPELNSLADLKVRIFADGADKTAIEQLCALPHIQGFTTNPTLMRKAGITNYRAFARDVLHCVGERPVSFEVLADDFPCMEAQAREIASWGPNVYVKIPVTNTTGEPAFDLMRRLAHSGVCVNATARMTLDGVGEVASALSGGAPSCVSVL